MKKAILFFLSFVSISILAQPSIQLVKSFTSGTSGSNMVTLNSKFLFQGKSTTEGSELWESDGTTTGTVLLKDIKIGTTSSSPSNFKNALGKVLFVVFSTSPSIRYHLYTTDGTAAGTYSLCELSHTYPASPTGGVIQSITSGKEISGKYFFVVENAATGAELWSTDGTLVGTTMVKDINVGPASSEPSSFEVLNNKLYFKADDGINGKELWTSDGTSAGTVLVKDIRLGSAASNISEIQTFNNEIYFGAYDGSGSSTSHLWKSDGTTAGTQKMAVGNLTAISSFKIFNSKLYFTATLPTVETELFVTDGTVAGTTLVADIDPGMVNGSIPGSKVSFNNELYFSARTVNTAGHELMKYSPITNSVVLVEDVNPGINNGITTSNSLGLSNIVATSSYLAFVANDSPLSTLAKNIYVSDGTAAGTSVALYINTTNTTVNPYSLTVFNNEVYFFANYTGDNYLYKIGSIASGVKEDKNLQINFTIYPNPTKDILHIELNTILNNNNTVTITNILGEIVLTETSPGNKFSINTSNLISGVYFVTISNKGIQSTQKIIIE